MGKRIEIHGNPYCRFGNWLYWIFQNENYDIDNDIIVMNKSNHDYDITMNALKKIGVKYEIDKSLEFCGFYDFDYKKLNINDIRNKIIIPNDIKEQIYKNIPDIEERVCINVRRCDYLSYPEFYYIMSKTYIENTYKKYYNGMKVLVISDDIEWCAKNLSDICDDIVMYHFDDILCDFFSITLSNAVIAGSSTFSMWGIYLNKNNDCVIYTPSLKNNTNEDYIPDYAKREPITDDMK